MKKEKQICSLEYAKKLEELGVKQDSLYVFVDTRKSWKKYNYYNTEKFVPFNGLLQSDIECELVLNKGHYPNKGYNEAKPISAFTVAELGEEIKKYKDIYEAYCKCGGDEGSVTEILFEVLDVNFLAKMLIYLLENKLI